MSEEQNTTGKNAPNEVGKRAERVVFSWRQALIDRALKLLALVLLPVAVGSLYALQQAGIISMLPIVILAYLWLAFTALFSQIPYRWRVWGFLIALYMVGGGDLIFLGWGMNARLLLMACALFAIIFDGARAGYITLGIASATLLGFIVGERAGVLPIHSAQITSGMRGLVPLLSGWGLFTILGVGGLASLDYLYPRMLRIIDQLRGRLQGMEAEREQLQERLQILQASNLTFQRRAMYLEASLEVSQVLSTLFEVEPLLDRAVNLITQHFGFYHTGIFLMDEADEWAILRAASSAGGRRMLAKGHRLRRGGDSMVGWVVEYRQPRIAADVGADAVHFENPDLPATHSEIALPLMISGRVIGVLDVQSTEEAAFDQDDVRALEGMAGQLSVAIHNARRLGKEASLLEASSPFYRLARRLATARTEYEIHMAMLGAAQDFNPMRSVIVRSHLEVEDQQLSESANRSLVIAAEMRRGKLYIPEQRALTAETADYYTHVLHLARAQMEPLLIADLSDLPETLAVSEALQWVIEESRAAAEARSLALIPIRVEETLLGVLLVLYGAAHKFAPLEARLYRVLGDMGGLALENARLLAAAQERAEREQLTSEISAHVQAAATDIDEVLQTTLRELGVALQASGAILIGSGDRQQDVSS